MKKIVFAGIAASLFTACSVMHPEIRTDNLYGAEYSTTDTTSVADFGWRELFADERLQRLIDTALVHNTDLQVARLRITEAEATLKATGDATEATLHDLQHLIRQTENSLTFLLGDTPHAIERNMLETQSVPTGLLIGVPISARASRRSCRHIMRQPKPVPHFIHR